ncbi:hypothetical protein ACTA71_004837 [Dictyostelium dimigraforme]
MKISIISNLIIILFCSVIVSSQTAYPLFANFIPYRDSLCQSDIFGLGFTLPMNSCTTFNWNTQVYVDQFWSIQSTGPLGGPDSSTFIYNYQSNDSQCQGVSNHAPLVYETNICENSPSFFHLNSTNDSSGDLPTNSDSSEYLLPHYGFTILQNSDVPMEVPNSIVFSQYHPTTNGQCTNENLMFAYYISTGLEFYDQNDILSTYLCIDNVPYLKKCLGEKCYQQSVQQECYQNEPHGGLIVKCSKIQ